MFKKSLIVLSIGAAYLLQAQDVSTLKNTADIYSGSSLPGSAKYNAMAGSIGALGGEASVLNSNPAGIGVAIASDISATLNIDKVRNTSMLAGQQLDYTLKNTDLGNVGGIASFQVSGSSPWRFVNVGVNYSNISTEDYVETPGNAAINFDISNGTGVIDNLAFAGHAYNRYGNTSKMSLGVGGNYDNRLYVGAGLNFHSSALDQYDSAAFTSAADGTTDVYNKQYTPYSESSDGFSASVGVIAKVNPQFRVGAAIETPTWWTINRVYREYENPTDGTYAEDRKLSTPLKATLSVAFVPNKNFALNVDYVLGLSKTKFKEYGTAEQELNNFYSDYGRNVSEIKAGAEYRYEGFRLRGGYGYAAGAFKDVGILSFGDQGAAQQMSAGSLLAGNRSTIGAGIGYDFKSFYIDAAYQNVKANYSSPFLAGSDNLNTGYFSDRYIVNSDASAVSDVDMKRDQFFITLGWKF